MKKILIIGLTLFLSFQIGLTQNRISNPSFEERSSSASGDKPDMLNGIQEGWCKDWVAGGPPTSDWIIDESPFTSLYEILNGAEGTIVTAAEGRAFAAMLSEEMIQTDVGEVTTRQKLSFNIRIPRGIVTQSTNGVFSEAGGLWFSGDRTITLDVFMSPNKMEDSDNFFWCNNGTTARPDYGNEAILVTQIPVNFYILLVNGIKWK